MVRRRRLAAELRRLREAAKLTCDDVAALLECSASKISRIETGRVLADPRDVRDLASIYGVSPDQSELLVQLARQARQKGWWQAYDAVLPHLATYLAMEDAASEIRHYSLTRIPTLLQTEDYARAVFTAGQAGYPHPSHDVQTRMVMERQRHAAASGPKVWAIMDEAALRHQVGGWEVMRAQIEHLVGLTATKDCFLQFLPFSGGANAAMDLPFTVLSFPDPADPEVVCIAYPTGIVWVEDLAEVRRYSTLFHHLQADALSLDDSVALMIDALKGLQSPLPGLS